MKSTRYDCLLKVLIIGEPYVGKSSLLLQYADGYMHNEMRSTIGSDFKLKNVNISGRQVKLQLWDTAGQERCGTLTRAFDRNA